MLQNRKGSVEIDFSIIIPIYNKRRYIEKCLESIENSSFKNIEVICIDDASTDGSVEFVPRNKGIKVFRHLKNRGVSNSRNQGIDEAVGKYILFLDADDYLDQYALEKYFDSLEKSGADGCMIKILNQDGTTNINHSYQDSCSGRELLRQLVLNNESFLYACGAVWRNDYLKKNNIRFKELKIGEGGLFILEALLKANKMAVSDYPGYHYIVNETSTNQRRDSIKLSAIGQLKQIVFMILQLAERKENSAEITFLEWYLKQNMGGINNLTEEDLVAWFDHSQIEEAFLSRLVKGNYLEKRITICDADEEIIKKIKSVYIYGAGYETLDVLRYCNRMGVIIQGVYVSDRSRNPASIYGFEVKEFKEEKNIDVTIPFLISAHKKHHDEIECVLREAGIKRIIKIVGE